MPGDRVTAVADLWKAHQEAAFPRRLIVEEVAGVEMVMLDADVAGSIMSWLGNGGDIDDRRWDVLAVCEQNLIRVIPELADYEASYFQRLLEMAVLVLDPDAHP